jgi:TM2 domain-containing membrane protein YozV
LPVPTAQSEFRTVGNNGQIAREVRDFSSKKIAAGICGILLGSFGVHKFILGLNTAGTIMLAISLVGLICLGIPWLVMIAIGLAEGIVYLTMSDEDFFENYAVRKKEWF